MSPDPRNRLQRTVTPNNVPYAALHGAFKAFNSPVPPPKPSSLRRDSASSLTIPSVARHDTNNSVTSTKSYLGTVSDRRGNGRLQKPRPDIMLQRANTDVMSAGRSNRGQDTEPVALPSARGLAQRFEDLNTGSGQTMNAASRTLNIDKHSPDTQKPMPPILSPKPRKALTLKSVTSGVESPKSRPATPVTSTVNAVHSSPASEKKAVSSLADTSLGMKPLLPPPRRTKKTAAGTTDPTKVVSLTPPLPVRSQTADPRAMRDALKTSPAFDSRSLSPPIMTRTLSRSPNLAQYKHQSMLRIGPYMSDVNTLANAIQGANLAIKSLPQSRQPSPAPRLPSPRRKHHFLSSRSPSPARRTGMLQQTLRREQSASSDSSGERHGFLKHRHPNKHAEGDRKHWRDVITPSERKLYESLWASNKGLLIDPRSLSTSFHEADHENEVLDLVVRDVWSRSGLQPYALEEIWDLVDRRHVHRLTREEFVVGLWLIDQRLKGRKLPHRVADSVWGSVTGLGRDGVKVRIR